MPTHTATCQCGALTARFEDDPDLVIACNCRACQKRTGSPFGTGAYFQKGLMTVEGEKDDITGRGQTRAALDLSVNLPDAKKHHYVQPKVGHYGVFNGSRFRKQIQPQICDFIRAQRKPVVG